MRRLILTSMAISAVAGTAGASNLSFSLSAHVPVMCSVTGVQPINLATGDLLVDAVCNTDVFRVIPGGDIAGMTPQSASANNASASVGVGGVTIAPSRPGQFQIHLAFGQDLSAVRNASFDIQAY